MCLRISVLLLFVILNLLCFGSQTRYPSYTKVVVSFFDKYNFPDEKIIDELRFEKREDGWYYVRMEGLSAGNGARIVDKQLFWSKSKLSFQQLSVAKRKKKDLFNKKTVVKYIENSSEHLYAVHPYYGYIGWEKDVIDDFQNFGQYSDSLLYGVGRAYSSYASSLLQGFDQFSDPTIQYQLSYQKEALSESQLRNYRKYRHKGIEIFRSLAERNPDFQMHIGKIGVKLANEQMLAYLDLRTYHNTVEANKEISEVRYSPSYELLAENYLNTCEPNAILITEGDNDTYPLMYVQAKKKIRQDVLVINVNLLSSSRYVESLRGRVMDSDGLPLSISPEELRQKEKELIYVYPQKKQSVQLVKLIEDLKQDTYVLDKGFRKYAYFPTKNFIYTHNSTSIFWEYENYYMERGQLVLLDVIANNGWKRPIYFGQGLSEINFLGLENYLKLEGLAYRLDKKRKKKGSAGVSSDVMYKKIMEDFLWESIESGDQTIQNSEYLYATTFAKLSEELIDINRKDSAEAVMDKYLSIFHSEVCPFGYYTLYIAAKYYQLEKNKKAESIILKVVENLRNIEESNLNADNKLLYKVYGLKVIKNLCDEYGQSEFWESIEQ